MRHLIDPLDLSPEEITSLLDLADRIRSDPAAYQDVAAHKKLATLFYEPSTRTRLSFEAAMLNLGGHVLGFPSENVSSASKGESVADTIRVVSCYADIVAMRHPKEGAPLRASRYSRIPVINAGDGGHQHPTQTMTDLMTIRTRMGRLDDLTIGLCGDLKFGRTVHSLIKTMARCKNIRFVLISPEELRVPDYIIKDVLEANGIAHARLLAQKSCHVCVPGGLLRPRTEAIIGAAAITALQQFNFTKAFIGANGVALNVGFTTPDPEEAAVKAVAVRRARETWYLVDDSKFGRVYPAVIGEIYSGAILTNRCPDPKYRQLTLVKETEQ